MTPPAPPLPLLFIRLGLLPLGDVIELLLLELGLVLDNEDNFSGSCCLMAAAFIFGALVALTRFAGGALLMLAVLHLSFLRSMVDTTDCEPEPIPLSTWYSSLLLDCSSCCVGITPPVTGRATLGDSSKPWLERISILRYSCSRCCLMSSCSARICSCRVFCESRCSSSSRSSVSFCFCQAVFSSCSLSCRLRSSSSWSLCRYMFLGFSRNEFNWCCRL